MNLKINTDANLKNQLQNKKKKFFNSKKLYVYRKSNQKNCKKIWSRLLQKINKILNKKIEYKMIPMNFICSCNKNIKQFKK